MKVYYLEVCLIDSSVSTPQVGGGVFALRAKVALLNVIRVEFRVLMSDICAFFLKNLTYYWGDFENR